LKKANNKNYKFTINQHDYKVISYYIMIHKDYEQLALQCRDSAIQKQWRHEEFVISSLY